MTSFRRVLTGVSLAVCAAFIIAYCTSRPAEKETYVAKQRTTHFITFAQGDCYSHHARNLADQAGSIGRFDRVFVATIDEVDPWFKERNSHIFAQPRGHGYWLWKPYVIFRYALERMDDGDVAVYIDSLYRFQARGKNAESFADWIAREVAEAPDGVLLMKFKPEPNRWEYREREWCKADAYAILGAEDDDTKDSTQVWGGFFAFRRCTRSLCFISEWLTYCQDARALTDAPSVLSGGKEDPALVEHRHDQSILSLLAKKRGIPFSEFPTGFLVDLRHAGEGSC